MRLLGLSFIDRVGRALRLHSCCENGCDRRPSEFMSVALVYTVVSKREVVSVSALYLSYKLYLAKKVSRAINVPHYLRNTLCSVSTVRMLSCLQYNCWPAPTDTVKSPRSKKTSFHGNKYLRLSNLIEFCRSIAMMLNITGLKECQLCQPKIQDRTRP